MDKIVELFLSNNYKVISQKLGRNWSKAIRPYLEKYLKISPNSLTDKTLKKRARHKFRLDSMLISGTWNFVKHDIQSGIYKEIISQKYKIPMRFLDECIKHSPSVSKIMQKNWYNLRAKRCASMASKGCGPINPGWVHYTEEQKVEIKTLAEKMLKEPYFMNRYQLYHSAGLCPNAVKRCLKELGIDNNKLPHGGRNLKGERNHWYGKLPPEGCGRGISGYILLDNGAFFFRSLLECHVFFSLCKQGISFRNAKISIPYSDGKDNRHYFPDLILSKNTLVEIKPTGIYKAIETNPKLRLIYLKKQAGKEYCLRNKMSYQVITEKDYNSYGKQAKQEIYNMYRQGNIWFFNEKMQQRFIKQIGGNSGKRTSENRIGSN